jgi:Tfp pilus assembly protein PilO
MKHQLDFSCCEYIWELERYFVACRQQESKKITTSFSSKFQSKKTRAQKQRQLDASLQDVESEYAQMLQKLAPGE